MASKKARRKNSSSSARPDGWICKSLNLENTWWSMPLFSGGGSQVKPASPKITEANSYGNKWSRWTFVLHCHMRQTKKERLTNIGPTFRHHFLQ